MNLARFGSPEPRLMHRGQGGQSPGKSPTIVGHSGEIRIWSSRRKNLGNNIGCTVKVVIFACVIFRASAIFDIFACF